MISMRYHIVSIAAVFLALALGIVLGATKVQSPILVGMQNDTQQLTEQRDQLQLQTDQLGKQAAADARVAADVAPLAVRGTLPKTSVVLISSPDVEAADRDAMIGLLAKSGATVSANIQLTTDFADPARSSELQSLVAKSLPAGTAVPEVASAGTMAGALLASVLVTDAEGKAAATSAEATAAMSALSAGGFVTANGTQTPGRVVLVLTGGEQSNGSEADRARTIADMAAAMRKSAGGVVVAGRSGSDGDAGAVGAVRGNPSLSATVSTVDALDKPSGRLAAVLALVEQAGGGVGQYGTGAGAQAPVPVLAVG